MCRSPLGAAHGAGARVRDTSLVKWTIGRPLGPGSAVPADAAAASPLAGASRRDDRRRVYREHDWLSRDVGPSLSFADGACW